MPNGAAGRSRAADLRGTGELAREIAVSGSRARQRNRLGDTIRTEAHGARGRTYKFLVFQDANWDYLTFNAERDIATGDKKAGALMNSIDPDLKPLFSRGGKVLMYHGWADPGIAPQNSVNYYNSVVEKLGKAAVSNSIRLFMVPGMGHCAGGDGTATFSMIDAISAWVEQGKAPDRIEASRVRAAKRTARVRLPVSATCGLQWVGQHG